MAEAPDNLPLVRWEDEPLLEPATKKKKARRKKRPKIGGLSAGGRMVVDLGDESDDDEQLAELERRSSPRRKLVELWPLELALICVEHLQYSALLLAMSFYWAFPTDYIHSLSFIFWVNLDAWDFYVVQRGVYQGARNSNLASASVGLDYRLVVVAWCVASALAVLAVLALRQYFRYRRRHCQRRTAVLYTLAAWAAMFGALPALHGSTRAFQCRTASANGTSRSVVDVLNGVECGGGGGSARAWLIAVPVLLVVAPVFGVLPALVWHWVRTQLVSGCPRRHEAYVRRKESEYGQGLGDGWLLGKWTLFSALRRRAVHYHALGFVLKLALGAAAWLSHDQRPRWKAAQASWCAAALGAWLLGSGAVWRGPFRVRALNVAHYVSGATLLLVSVLGALTANELETPLLRGQLLQTYLIAINAAAVGLLAAVWCYLLGKWWWWRRGKGKAVWPAMLSGDGATLAADGGDGSERPERERASARYLLAMMRAQGCLKAVAEWPPTLAPCHELERHVHIVNAYCREAEHERHRLHGSLWSLLDELSAQHAALMRVSVFAAAPPASARLCALELRRLLPAWQRQLARREHDFILMRPLKRRILLKLYVMSVFLSKCRQADRALRRAVAPSAGGGGKSERRKSVAVRFADDVMDERLHSSSSSSVQDYLRSSSQSTLGLLEEDDAAVHDRFLAAIDDLLPEQRARGFSVVTESMRLHHAARLQQANGDHDDVDDDDDDQAFMLATHVEEEGEEEEQATDQQDTLESGV